MSARILPGDPRHGTINGYSNLDCRCRLCREAHTAYHVSYMDSHPEQREKQRAYMRRYHAAKRAARAVAHG